MSDANPERRDLQGLVSDMRVDLAAIKTRSELQTQTLVRIEQRLELGVFREEYERRHADLQREVDKAKEEADSVRDDFMRRQGAQRVWRWFYGAALAALGAAEVWFHH